MRSIAPLSLPSDSLSVQLDSNEESSSLMLEYSDWRNCSPFCNECVIKKTSEKIFDWLKVGGEVGAGEAT